jgi:hypothetical protein
MSGPTAKKHVTYSLEHVDVAWHSPKTKKNFICLRHRCIRLKIPSVWFVSLLTLGFYQSEFQFGSSGFVTKLNFFFFHIYSHDMAKKKPLWFWFWLAGKGRPYTSCSTKEFIRCFDEHFGDKHGICTQLQGVQQYSDKLVVGLCRNPTDLYIIRKLWL